MVAGKATFKKLKLLLERRLRSALNSENQKTLELEELEEHIKAISMYI